MRAMRGILLLLPCALLLHGQARYGAVLGRIADPSGGGVATATLTLTNESTNVVKETVSSGQGDFTFPNVEPGSHRLSVSAPGFKTTALTGISVQVDQTVRMDVTLDVGDVQTRVEVSASAPVVQSETSSVGSVVDSRQITAIPLNGRANFYSLLALAPGVQGAGSNPLVAGGTWYGSTNMTLDGVTNNDVGNERVLGTVPSLDAVQEFKVIGNGASAEFGRGGAQIVMVTKSGTNEFHGSLFAFNRNRALAAKNFFATGLPKPAFNRNEFGGSIGGPILRDRLFFFGSYEGLRFRASQTNVVAMPTTELVAGDFSRVGTIRDPLTGVAFANNRIPESRMSAVSRELLRFASTPNLPGTGAAGLGPNFAYNVPRRENLDRYFGRVDYQASSSDRITGRLSYVDNGPFVSPAGGGTDKFGNWGGFGLATRNVMASYTRIISARAINDVRFGFAQERNFRTPQNPGFDPSSIIPGLISPVAELGGLPTVTITGFRGFDDLPGSGDTKRSYEIGDTFTLSLNRHTVKAGFEFQRASMFNFQNPPPYRGSFAFDGRYSGNAFADFLLGYPSLTGRVSRNVESEPVNNRYAAFIQDDWTVSSRLTLNLGLRYEYQGLFRNSRGDMSNFYPELGSIAVIGGTPDPRLTAALPVVDGSSVGIDADNYVHPDRNNFGPRIGFAFRPLDNNRFVLRGAYGIYYNVLPGYLGYFQLSTNPPFLVAETFEPAPGDVPSLSFSNPFPGQGTIPASPSITAVARDRRNPYQQQWNFTIEYELLPATALRASYLGNKITHLERGLNLNDPPPGPGAVQPRRPYQPFGAITYYEPGRNQITNQLQLGLVRRFTSGLAFEVEYQLTKGLSEQLFGQAPMDNRNARLDRGNLDFVRRHYATINYIYELPFGQGKRWLSSLSGAADKIVGGWQVAGVTTLATGTPYSVTHTSRTLGWPSGRADIVGDPDPGDRTIERWFNPGAFAVPAPFTYGNSARNMLFGPGLSTWDVGVFKSTRITERIDTQFRAEFFNIANHANFGNPGTDITVPSAVGRITSTSTDPRTIQFGLRLLF